MSKLFKKLSFSIVSTVIAAMQLPAMSASANYENFSVASASNLQYTTLDSAFTAEDGTILSAGTIAMTVSLSSNEGFDNTTLIFNVDSNYEIVTNSTGNPVFQKGTVLEDFLVSTAASDDHSTLSIAAASGTTTYETGTLITFYFTNTSEIHSNNPVSIADFTSPVTMTSRNASVCYGDVNNDQQINSRDASRILISYSQNGNRALLVEHLIRVPSKASQFFPAASSPICADCIRTSSDGIINVITEADADEILRYASLIAAGNSYVGRVGQSIDNYNNISQGTFSGVAQPVYELILDVPFVNNDVINGHGTCWLASIVSKYNYLNRNTAGFVNHTSSEVFYELADEYNATPYGTHEWIEDACSYLGVSHNLVSITNSAPIDYIDVYGQINYDNPMIMGLGTHNTVLCGITIMSDGTGIYHIVDSNFIEKQQVIMSATQMQNGYNLNYRNYPTWYYYIY